MLKLRSMKIVISQMQSNSPSVKNLFPACQNFLWMQAMDITKKVSGQAKDIKNKKKIGSLVDAVHGYEYFIWKKAMDITLAPEGSGSTKDTPIKDLAR